MYDLQQLMSRVKAAQSLDVKPQTLASWASNKRYDLPYIKVGRRAMYAPADIDAFIARNRVGGAA